MTQIFRHTLVCDGPTDANLIPILDWVLRQNSSLTLVQGICAELWRLPHPPVGMMEKLTAALDLYPCRVLFVHRDAEKEPAQARHEEIRAVVEALIRTGVSVPAVAVVPVRMLEAWLLLDEGAIRCAAGNPNGQQCLNLPQGNRIEDCPDPKQVLKDALRQACGLHGRRLRKFNVSRAFWRITDYQNDFTSLRQLPAFCQLEAAVRRMVCADYVPGFYGQTGSAPP